MDISPSESSTHMRRSMRLAAARQGSTTAAVPKDRFEQIGRTNGLARYIPAKSLRDSATLQLLGTVLNIPVCLPQYHFTARPVNRFLGGPIQPMSSSMGASFVTDMLWHQASTVAVSMVSEGSLDSLLHFRPNPFRSTAYVCGWGIPVGLYKLGFFQQSLNVQKLALQLSNNDPMLARKIGKLLKASMAPYTSLPRLGQAMLRLIDDHRAALPAELTAFARAVEAGDAEARATTGQLLSCARAYAENNDNHDKFAEGVRRLNAIVPIATAPWEVRDENRLLLQDAAKASVCVGLIVAEWAAWGVAASRGDPRARAAATNGGPWIIQMVGYLALVAVVANVMQRVFRSQGVAGPLLRAF